MITGNHSYENAKLGNKSAGCAECRAFHLLMAATFAVALSAAAIALSAAALDAALDAALALTAANKRVI